MTMIAWNLPHGHWSMVKMVISCSNIVVKSRLTIFSFYHRKISISAIAMVKMGILRLHFVA